GIGMSQPFLKKIFLPFEQEDETIRTNYKGTGLGMAIVKRMVDLLGGTIRVTSEKGEGTCVEIELSLKTAPEYQSKKPKESTVFYGTGLHILVAEDHTLNFEVLKTLLEKKGCIIDWAQNGQEACKLFLESEPGYYDFILMDGRMPVMDGLTAIRTIRSMDRKDASSITIIMLTANAYEEDIEAGKKAGADEYLTKPIDPEVLYRTLGQNM
ncbi:MAG: response regulator, partial [Lachnospiraceae bacterium]|nr:response regulator [Lachnospiraceae bacterium]